MYLAPLALADSVLTEAERRSGCALVDLGSDTTTVSVYSKNVLRHLAVIPLGSNNITKDIATLQIEESDAEKMKLKYGSAYTDNNEIDNDLKYSIDAERQIESRKFIEIVEGRLEEIIENVWYQIPSEYYDKLLGGIILTGGGSNLKNIDIAFRTHTIDKVSIASFVSIAINSGDPVIKRRDGMCNTVLGLLAKGYENCAGADLSKRDLFTPEDTPDEEDDGSGKANNFGGALAGEKARQEKERKEKAEQERLERERLEAQRKRELEERIRQENEKKPWNRFKKFISKVTEDMVRGEE
jgi:cell division protein FtsA